MMFNNLSHIRVARRADAEAGVSLAKRRTWFADVDGQQGEGGAASGTNGKTPIESLPADVQEYIKSLRGEAETARKTLKEKLDAAAAAQQAELAKQGNFEKLAQEHAAEATRLKAFETRAAALEQVLRDSNAERLKAIPDNKKALVEPLIDVLPPEKLQAYLNANPSLFVKEPAADYDAGAGAGNRGGNGGNNAPKVTDEDRRQAAIASNSGYTIKPEDIAKRRVEMAKAAASNGDK